MQISLDHRNCSLRYLLPLRTIHRYTYRLLSQVHSKTNLKEQNQQYTVKQCSTPRDFKNDTGQDSRVPLPPAAFLPQWCRLDSHCSNQLQVLKRACSFLFVRVITHVSWLVRCFCLHRFGMIFLSDSISFPANLWWVQTLLNYMLLSSKRYNISLKKS